MAAAMTPTDALVYHWGTAYAIWRGAEMYYAQNRQTRVVLTADTARELRLAIRADYRPVRRMSAVPTPGGAPTS